MCSLLFLTVLNALSVFQVHYIGRIYETDEEFDNSYNRDPFEFTLGQNQVIKGWDKVWLLPSIFSSIFVVHFLC